MKAGIGEGATEVQEQELVPALSASERLQLLQLLTRRAMDQRRDRPSNSVEEDDAEEASDLAAAAVEPLPDRWRLLPEGTKLHAWQDECLKLWLPSGRGTVKVATGGGKTLFALAAAARLQNEREADLRLVVVVPTIPLMHQWRDELRGGNVPEHAIALLGGGQEPGDMAGIRILICVLNSARDRLGKLVRKAAWARRMMLVVDECHRSNAERAQKIFDSKPAYTLGLSATPEHEGGSKEIPSDEAYAQSPVGLGLGPIIYDFSLKRALAAGLLTPFEVWHVGLSLAGPESIEHEKLSREITELRKPLQVQYKKSNSNQEFLPWCQTIVKRGAAGAADAERFIGLSNNRKRLLYRARARTEITLRILEDANAQADGRSIVFHESIDEIERLFLKALALGVPTVLEHSKLPDGVRAESIDAFRSGVARTIISAKSLVEGFNVPSADLGIIAASSGSARQRIQSLGRLLRRKRGGQHARVFVLYVRDTQDESIYQKADWEQVIGAERNRYFVWQAPGPGAPWSSGLLEVGAAPRVYRPPSIEVDARGLEPKSHYPGRPDGIDLRVDQSDSLRTEDGRLVRGEPALVRAILDLNPHRRAHRTAAGHGIVRVDSGGSKDETWLFLGLLPDPEPSDAEQVVRFKLPQSAGKRRIAREERGGGARYALGPDQSRSPDAGLASKRILEWIRTVEQDRAVKAKELCWDGQHRYWLEVQGQRIEHPDDLPALEFAQ